MRSPSQSIQNGRRVDEINMTPMIDVVFLLIIFFLVSSHLARQENRHAVDLPSAQSSIESDPNAAPINLTMDSSHQLWLGATQVDLDEMITRLSQTKSIVETPVRLRVDQSVAYRFVEPVLHRINRIGIRDLSIATLPSSNRSGASR
ncbi:ExbD/TolR family protein [Rhodopirellula baltica]|uniref:Biopolymer transport exbD protein n=1 Tax=Rhodopirellula baltica SWK14 TaxID=993516 RepID=L7CHA2_RHOBT|nr:biopolymer transporter ExbD [Rhodopirellula baltica]ELP32972.1 biopolymer transport exbD protein [Rhodopirellula baltica SWK14]